MRDTSERFRESSTNPDKVNAWMTSMTKCTVCPRECGVDRTAGTRGICRAPAGIIVARAALHFWEEPCISGRSGSGAVFFSGCSLGCVYCQNAEISGIGKTLPGIEEISGIGKTPPGIEEISGIGKTLPGIEVSVRQLSEIILRLQDEEKANNINLVTASHYIPQVAEALAIARADGLRIPVVFNSSGYEKVSSLRMLEGLVDVYLPDFKYISSQTARLYSHAPDYPERAKEAIAEMVRQTGAPSFYPENAASTETAGTVATDSETAGTENETISLIRKGVIVRHLLLPGHVSEAKEIVSYLYETYRDNIFISLMNQYTPMPRMQGDPLLGRRVTKREYSRLIDHAIEIGVDHGFLQEGGTAKESFIPAWNGEGVR